MKRFTQLHMLTYYPPSNLNRDDLGRPKTVTVGGTNRLRVSSQSLKRAWRTSSTFGEALHGHLGKRTKRVGRDAKDAFVAAGVKEEDATTWAKAIAEAFSKSVDENLETGQLVHLSPEELNAVDALVATIAKRRKAPAADELALLRRNAGAVDIAMFGRMLADTPDFSVDAAVQVAHAFTTHPVTVEEDYFTAVDDLKTRSVDAGAGHVGVNEFGAGLFYHYVCVDRESLARNLGGDVALANRAVAALVETMTTVGPTGKQNSFGSRAHASFLLAEKGHRQPRALSIAFLKSGALNVGDSVMRLDDLIGRLDRVYGGNEERMRFDVEAGTGTLADVKKFCEE